MGAYTFLGAAVTTVAALVAVIWAAVTYWPITLAVVILALLVVPGIMRGQARSQAQADFVARAAAVENETNAALQEVDDIYNHARARMEHLERLRRLR
ncbi:ABC-type dipeptide/oligopeptide/nickel transport system permease subunit [Kibdelosporangium banguiense]|uniref:ABC-type dipeptide/oligopeptide/nickel transport system permease subunit n=1 Tax=Kibdelosporangium banguiense TaxID=1365924 RepID=A0ABS4TDY4_9PSEU|nr:hypothetical protein [Kibdelosporangium banguiense]MBP2322627.1 ABC-type dipeptide/oligopeptide/nickel transport system permease subunit [Kibdelosporangium banguiense]